MSKKRTFAELPKVVINGQIYPDYTKMTLAEIEDYCRARSLYNSKHKRGDR